MEWISIKDKLPEWQEIVLCYINGEGIYKLQGVDILQFVSDGFIHHEYGEMEGITHWMELPKPPKE
jgi:hypothetical protein